MIDPTHLNVWVWKESDRALRINWLMGSRRKSTCDDSHTNSFAMLLTCLDVDCRVPTRCHSWGSVTCFGDWLYHDRVLALIPTSNISAYLQVKIMATNMQSTVKRAIRVLGKYYIDPIDSSVDLLHLLSEFIGIVDDKVSRPLIIKYSPKTNAPLQTLKHRFNNRKRTEQKLKLGQSGRWDKL